TRVRGAREGVVLLRPDEELRARTLVWTAGTAPHPLLQTLPVQRDRSGGVNVDPTLGVLGRDGIWALGDCAALPNGHGGATCPPTAQFAVREAALLARNFRARLQGRPPKASIVSPSVPCVSSVTTRPVRKSKASASRGCSPGSCGAPSTSTNCRGSSGSSGSWSTGSWNCSSRATRCKHSISTDAERTTHAPLFLRSC